MRKKILAFVFAAAVLMAMAVPLFGGVGTASAHSTNPGQACAHSNAKNTPAFAHAHGIANSNSAIGC